MLNIEMMNRLQQCTYQYYERQAEQVKKLQYIEKESNTQRHTQPTHTFSCCFVSVFYSLNLEGNLEAPLGFTSHLVFSFLLTLFQYFYIICLQKALW